MPDRIHRRGTPRDHADRNLELSLLPPVLGRGQGNFREAGAEPRLAEMLTDPIVHLVMQRDRVSTGDVLSLFR